VIRLNERFSGFRWSECIASAPTDRWLRRSAFVAAEVADDDDVLLVLSGRYFLSEKALAGLTVDVNGAKVRVVPSVGPDGWTAVGVVPKAKLKGNGVLGLLLEVAEEGRHPVAGDDKVVSLSVGSIKLYKLATSGQHYTASAGEMAFAAGWHEAETTNGGSPFRWMGKQGIVALTGLPAEGPVHLRLSGPFAMTPVSAMVAELDGVPAVMEVHQGRGATWVAKLRFPKRPPSSASAGLLVLRAETRTPGNDDPRLLSVAVSDVLLAHPGSDRLPTYADADAVL
jgi:hypothetical protein